MPRIGLTASKDDLPPYVQSCEVWIILRMYIICAHSGETLEQIDVIEQGGADAGRSFVIVFGDVADDLGKIV